MKSIGAQLKAVSIVGPPMSNSCNLSSAKGLEAASTADRMTLGELIVKVSEMVFGDALIVLLW